MANAMPSSLLRLELVPIEFEDAAEFVLRHHRHHTPPVGHKFSLAAMRDDVLEGVAIIGRPVSRERQDGFTLEVTRLCVREDAPRVVCRDGKDRGAAACSFLYRAAAKATFALGYRRIGTYVLKREGGHSVLQAGYKIIGEVRGRSWNCKSRPRVDKHPTEDKLLLELAA
jgi:hypothetical protein